VRWQTYAFFEQQRCCATATILTLCYCERQRGNRTRLDKHPCGCRVAIALRNDKMLMIHQPIATACVILPFFHFFVASQLRAKAGQHMVACVVAGAF
jgi:hypothetical protein